MNSRIAWVEGDYLYCRKSPDALKLHRLKDIHVKEYDSQGKFKRSTLIGLVFSFVFFLVHPIVAAVVFLVLFGISFSMAKKYELRVTVFNNSDVGVVESGLCSANTRDEFDDVVQQVKHWQAQASQ